MVLPRLNFLIVSIRSSTILNLLISNQVHQASYISNQVHQASYVKPKTSFNVNILRKFKIKHHRGPYNLSNVIFLKLISRIKSGPVSQLV